MHGYILIVGVALAGIIARVFLLETFRHEDKVAIVEITNVSPNSETNSTDSYLTTKTDV